MFSACTFVHLSVHPFLRSETCEHDILKPNELILMQICTSGSRGRDMKRAALVIMRSNIKISQG